MKPLPSRAILFLTAVLMQISATAIAQVPIAALKQPMSQPPASIANFIAAPSSSGAAWLTPAISALAGLLGAFIGGYFATRNAKAAIVQKTNELEIEAIDKRITDFIAPYEQLSLENLKLSREIKRGRDPDKFRTLVALLDPNWKKGLSPGDKAVVDGIVENALALREMILKHGGAVSSAIRPHLAAASMHFRMLGLADAGSLENDPVRYKDYVYPRQLDDVLALERQRLEARRELLRSRPDTSHRAIEDLIVPSALTLPNA